MLIARQHYIGQIHNAFKVTPIVALLGPRQSGKTTLAKEFLKGYGEKKFIFDLEDPDYAFAFKNPKLVLDDLRGLIVIDEVQLSHEIFPYLRYYIDKAVDSKILLLGSASQELVQRSSETLAGRISYIEVTPFSLDEVGNSKKLWLKGGFPASYLKEGEESFAWRKEYIKTYLERDIRELGFKISIENLRRFWMMLVNYHGQIFNASEIARALQLDQKTVKYYLDILCGTFMIRQLQPWHANIAKRQVKSYKIYFRDSGILHNFLNIKEEVDLSVSNKVGASWEGFAMEQVIRKKNADIHDCFFWATQAGAEIDLLISHGQKIQAFEFKYSSSPKITASMRNALVDLNLDEIKVIIPGTASYFLDEKIRVIGLDRLFQ